eukprot:116701-Chlamydomonas_euryale.AAC.1
MRDYAALSGLPGLADGLSNLQLSSMNNQLSIDLAALSAASGIGPHGLAGFGGMHGLGSLGSNSPVSTAPALSSGASTASALNNGAGIGGHHHQHHHHQHHQHHHHGGGGGIGHHLGSGMVSPPGVPPGAASRQRLFVVVHKGASADAVSRLFRRLPGMEYCDLKLDRATCKSKGFAYVNYSTPDAACAAIEQLNGLEFPPHSGHRMKVMYAEPLGSQQSGSSASSSR